MAIAAVVIGRRRERRGRMRRSRASRLTCFSEEEEGEEAELLVRFDLLREACVDGGVRRRLGQLMAMAPF